MSKKGSAVLRIVLFALIAIALISVLMGGIGVNSLFSRKSTTGSDLKEGALLLEDTLIDAEGIDALNISWVAGDVSIRTEEQSGITVTEDRRSSDRPLILRQSGSTLVVEFCESSWFSSLSSKKNLTVVVPTGWAGKKLTVNGVSARLTCTGLALDDLELSTVSGVCSFQNCSADNAKVKSVSGDLNFNGTLKKLSFDGASARANIIVDNVPDEIRMDSVSGNLNLTLPESSGFSLQRDSLSGGFDSDFPTETDGSEIVSGDGACKIALSGVSASVHIHSA